MLLIYTHKITPRFTFTMKQMFTRILGIDVRFCTEVEDFIKHSGPKITYTKQPLQNEFFVRSNDLLFEQGVNDLEITPADWEGVPCFFKAGERSNLPFDIFSASFFLLSRYEEYLPHVKDEHGRFPPKDSLAYRHKFLKLPVVDIWAYKLLDKLKDRFPDLEAKSKNYRYTSVIDVTTSHSFAHRGLFRSVAGLFYDLATLKFRRVVQRVQVWFDSRKDPYDNFSHLIDLHKRYKVNSMFFFQFASYSTYDKNVSTNNNKFRFLIKSIADYSKVALAASYSSFNDLELLKKEKKKLTGVINRSIDSARMRYNRVDIPHTYRNLMDAEFSYDYSMGYTHEIGFRAGTCTPFYFYDIPLEIQQPIQISPFAIHDYAFLNHKSKAEIVQIIDVLYQRIKDVEGQFITVFSNELLGGSHKVDWQDLYTTVLKNYNV
ncbi:polysaccharide deacetylase family protein [Pareuzebyella sediminis]|uniref:polysaccharide deacetylase family protein n=1 Tax=Pareuzebyella sediminis TaxID=2607998 RepID=UPI0011EDDD53|nr:polysaccharide deacetylase family protein [Pareuzebyella sediminis]